MQQIKTFIINNVMTQKELDKYIKLQEKFQLRCEAICEMLKPINYNYYYLSDFYIDEDKVYGEGDAYWQYGGHEHHSSTFPASYLCMSDDAIKKIVEDELKRREEAKLEELKRRENAAAILQKKRDREEYERLKKIFEGE